MVSVTGGTEEDIIARIRKAQQAFACLRAVWKATSLSLKTKIRIFNSNIKLVLLYGSETWRLTKTLLSKVQTFVNKRLRQLLGIFWRALGRHGVRPIVRWKALVEAQCLKRGKED